MSLNFFRNRSRCREDFWGDYKLRFPKDAYAIEQITGENFSLLSNKDAKEKISSLQRLARNNGCSIAEVKDVFMRSFASTFGYDREVIKQAIQRAITEIDREALRFNVDRENTASYYITNWLQELLSA